MPYSEIYMMHNVLLMHHTTIFREIWIRSTFVVPGITRHPILCLIPQTIGRGIYLSLYLLGCGYWYHMVVLLLFEHWCILHTVELWHIVLGCKLQLILVLLDQVIFSSMAFFCHKVTCICLTWDQLYNWYACVSQAIMSQIWFPNIRDTLYC